MAAFTALRSEVFERQHRRQYFRDNILGLNALDRHKKFINDYVHFYGGTTVKNPQRLVKTDEDTLKESYRFIRSEEDDVDGSWEQRLAKKYYDKLFKEYCLADMTRYKESKIGLRWRTEKEVVVGKGQFICGSKSCDVRDDLHSYEVNFAYKEAGDEKQALVKLRVCPKHAMQLNYRKEKEKKQQLRQEERRLRKRRRESGECDVVTGKEGDEFTENGGGEKEEEGEKKEAEGKEGEEDQPAHLKGGTLSADESVWRRERAEQESNKEEEFDEYFKGMFL